jgi:hypothetical protein
MEIIGLKKTMKHIVNQKNKNFRNLKEDFNDVNAVNFEMVLGNHKPVTNYWIVTRFGTIYSYDKVNAISYHEMFGGEMYEITAFLNENYTEFHIKKI